jgi:hypothetical protein
VKWWEFGDWTGTYHDGVPPQEADGGSTFLSLQFIEALQAAGEMESQYGSPERVQQYQAMIRKASDALNQMNWDDRYGLYADTPAKNSWSQEANILAVMLDVAAHDQQQAILRRLLASKPGEATSLEGKTVPAMSEPSYYFRFYLSRALEHAGLADLYLGQLRPWYTMLDLGLSTWAETPEPTRSDCHAWSASPNYDFLATICGIVPDRPGFARVKIAPAPGELQQIKGSMPHPLGTITVSIIRKGAHGMKASITLPPGLDGVFVWEGKERALHSGRQDIEVF